MYVVADKQPGCVEEAGQQYIQKLSGGALSFNGTKEITQHIHCHVAT